MILPPLLYKMNFTLSEAQLEDSQQQNKEEHCGLVAWEKRKDLPSSSVCSSSSSSTAVALEDEKWQRCLESDGKDPDKAGKHYRHAKSVVHLDDTNDVNRSAEVREDFSKADL